MAGVEKDAGFHGAKLAPTSLKLSNFFDWSSLVDDVNNPDNTPHCSPNRIGFNAASHHINQPSIKNQQYKIYLLERKNIFVGLG